MCTYMMERSSANGNIDWEELRIHCGTQISITGLQAIFKQFQQNNFPVGATFSEHMRFVRSNCGSNVKTEL